MKTSVKIVGLIALGALFFAGGAYVQAKLITIF